MGGKELLNNQHSCPESAGRNLSLCGSGAQICKDLGMTDKV